jgi:GNAT superfamily N-acetyltransferase
VVPKDPSAQPATIETLRTVSDEYVEAVARLLPQLSRAPIPSREHLEWVVSCETNDVLVARGPDGAIVGTTTLVTFPLATGIRAWIHDVVVDEGWRGRGVGAALTLAALEHARKRGAWTVDLTTRPWREEANRLYEAMGFERRDTNTYRFSLTGH